MSKFIKVNGTLINTGAVESVSDGRIVMRSGEVILAETFCLDDNLENDGQFIPAQVSTYVVQPYESPDNKGKVELEEYPVLGWRVSTSWRSFSEATPVFHDYPGEFSDGRPYFERPRFPLAVRFADQNKIWCHGSCFTRDEFAVYCEERLSTVKTLLESAAESATKSPKQQEK